MTRKLRPCGTHSAYRRHLYRKEEPCRACREANAIRVSPKSAKAMEADMADALDEKGPVILWEKNRRGIFVAVYIDDPHAEREPPARTSAEQARHLMRLEQQNQRRLQQRRAERGIAWPDVQVEYVECTDPELLAAARTEL